MVTSLLSEAGLSTLSSKEEKTYTIDLLHKLKANKK